MQKSNAPTKLTVAFASGTGAGPVNAVPLTPGATPGTASYQTGFTSVNMEPIASGGVPPFGADFNGVFQAATTAQIWQQSGYMWPFDSTFAGNANIGGYPAGSVLMMGNGKGLWINQTDNNTHSPDATGSTGWLGVPAAGIYTITTTGGTTTPDASVLGVTTLLVTGALTSNATIVLPLSAGSRWIIANNTTGSFTLTVQGATGAGVAITQGSALTVFTDGTAYFAASANLSGAYLPIDGTAVAATKLATPRNISMSGDVTWTVSFDGTANATAAGTIANGAITLAKMANLTGNTLLGNPTGSSAVPQAITLANGLTFSGTTLGLGVITPAGVSTTGTITLTASGSTPSKHIRSDGASLRVTNNADSAYILTLSDAGDLTVPSSIATGTGTFSGAVTCATMNATSSDRRLKRDIRKFAARPLHRSVPLVSYEMRANGWHGIGSIAQRVRRFAPEHVGEFEQDGKKYLSLNYAGMAYEQAVWASREVDRLAAKIEKLERKLARASIHPRQRGFLRLLLEAIW
jgi:hypothetical protein